MNHDGILPPNSVDSTSITLLHRIKSGDEVAWQTLVRLYGPIVAYWIRGKSVSGADAADVYQEVFYAVARNIARFERQEGSGKFRRWLKVITYSKIANHFRQLPHDQTCARPINFDELPQLNDESPSNEEIESAPELDDLENAAIVQGIVRLIRGEFREKTWLSFWNTAVEGREAADVAAELQLSPEAVRTNKSRVLARLREALQTCLG